MNDSERKPNIFVRCLISIFCILLALMVFYNYVYVEPKGEINKGIIILLCLLLVLVMSESFDNFSIVKILSISRQVKVKEKEVEKLETQNSKLLSQLISISTNQSQTQSHTNVYGDYHAGPSVEKATEEEVEEKQSAETESNTETTTEPVYRINWRKAEKIGLKKYLKKRNIHLSNVIVEAKLVTQFHGVDPISSIQPIYDGYLKENDHETFIELRPARYSPMYRDRLYVMLSKIYNYRNLKKVDAHLDLVIMKLPDDNNRSTRGLRFLETFEPAIASGLLKIHEIEFSEEELSEIKEEV